MYVSNFAFVTAPILLFRSFFYAKESKSLLLMAGALWNSSEIQLTFLFCFYFVVCFVVVKIISVAIIFNRVIGINTGIDKEKIY